MTQTFSSRSFRPTTAKHVGSTAGESIWTQGERPTKENSSTPSSVQSTPAQAWLVKHSAWFVMAVQERQGHKKIPSRAPSEAGVHRHVQQQLAANPAGFSPVANGPACDTYMPEHRLGRAPSPHHKQGLFSPSSSATSAGGTNSALAWISTIGRVSRRDICGRWWLEGVNVKTKGL